MRTLPCRVVQVERLTEDVVRLQLKLPDTERCAWRSPGFAIDWSRGLADLRLRLLPLERAVYGDDGAKRERRRFLEPATREG